MIDISGFSRADVLRVLYNNARPLGMGFLHFTPGDMEQSEAENLVEAQSYFDYVRGRVIKVNLPDEATEFDECLYDRDNGSGAAQRAIDTLLE